MAVDENGDNRPLDAMTEAFFSVDTAIEDEENENEPSDTEDDEDEEQEEEKSVKVVKKVEDDDDDEDEEPEQVKPAAVVVTKEEEKPEEIKPVSEVIKPVEEEKKVWTPEFATEADRAIYDKLAKGEQKEVWKLLNDKFAHENWDNDKKVTAYIAAKNPDLTEEEVQFLAETEYGIGFEKPADEDLTPEDKRALLAMSIKMKGAVKEANTYFTDKADGFKLPELANPIETDEGYKTYKEQVAAKEAEKVQVEKTIQLIDTTAQTIKKVILNDEINLDEGKFAFKVDFDITPKKQTQLAEYAKGYTPSKSEIEANSKDGKLDMTSYLSYLAEKCFHKSIVKAAVKQALSADRDSFLNSELLNNKIGNNQDNSSAPDRLLEDWEVFMGAAK